jgi:hypothetical protein
MMVDEKAKKMKNSRKMLADKLAKRGAVQSALALNGLTNSPGEGMANRGTGGSTYTQGGAVHAKMTGRKGK